MVRIFLIAAFVAFLAGCNSYRIVQENVFSDEAGNLVSIRYGVAEKDHVNTFVAPMTGKEMEFKSKLVVLAEVPGDDFKAWQCMNFESRGTMYQTDDRSWKVLLNGFSCVLFQRRPGARDEYVPVFRGVLCDTPDIDVKKDDRWKTIRPKSRRERKSTSQK